MENELIRVEERDGRKVVNARELHKGLEIKTQFSIWFDRMQEYGFEENVDFVRVIKNDCQNSTLFSGENYAISLDMAKEISMIQRNELGKQFRQYFIECEKQLLEQKQFLPQTYKEALLELVATLEPKLENQNYF